MKYYLIIFLLLFSFGFCSLAQDQPATLKLQQQANKMGDAFIRGDYPTFASYIYPLLLKSIGGIAKMQEELNKVVSNMRTRGMSFANIVYDVPSKIEHRGGELQATILQHTIIKAAQQGKLVSTSMLIAISKDKGNNWRFIDTYNKNRTMIKKILPNLSPTITIPPQQSPTVYSN